MKYVCWSTRLDTKFVKLYAKVKKEIEMIITNMSKDLLKAKFLFFIILAEKKLNEQNNNLLNNEVKMSNRGVEKISDILV